MADHLALHLRLNPLREHPMWEAVGHQSGCEQLT